MNTAVGIIIGFVLGLMAVMAVKPEAVHALKSLLGNDNDSKRQREEEQKRRLKVEIENLNNSVRFNIRQVSNLESLDRDQMQRISNLEDYIRDLVASLSRDNENLRKSIASLENKVQEYMERTRPETYSDKNLSEKILKWEYPKTCYALYPDKEIRGFRSIHILEHKENAIYQIVFESEDRATYSIIPNESMRKQLFQMMNSVVEPFCDIIVSSDKGETIRDVTPGKLKKIGENWIIETKAVVEVI